MRLRNQRGDAIDPVPFLVSASIAFLVCYSFVPATLLEIGFSLVPSLAITTVGFCCAAVAAYHRLVWTANPEIRSELSVQTRLHGILYAVLAGIVVLGALALFAFFR